RNAYGPQIESFETDVELSISHERCQGYFIRAPKIIEVGPRAKSMATLNDEIVGVIQGNIIGVTFHPEVAKSTQIHEIFVDLILQRLK
ncbi:MAG TPA: pyridoxal 5'-phosphate synthase glutaminase subunit PdxT, partial [Acidimicrobiia bacterium]|nr:pyridoxal 5'-phosphate synthase glutaminase subunit PdxT [Acidimicrobiia bacterium]